MKVISLIIAMGLLIIFNSKAQHLSGCASPDAAPISKQWHVAKSTRNPQLDRWLAKEELLQQSFFGVKPSLVIYNDSLIDKRNTYVSIVPETEGAGGTVAIGYNYLQNMYNYAGNFSMIPIVAAHGFAHILDFNLKATPATVVYKELYADFMAGCFMAYSSNQAWLDISRSFRWIIRIGDYVAVSDPTCYGTPMQRMDAFKCGYDWYKSQLLANVKVEAGEASNAARQYLKLPAPDNAVAANK